MAYSQTIEDLISSGHSKKLREYLAAAHMFQLVFLWQSGNFLVNAAAKLKQGHTPEQLSTYKKYLNVTKKLFLSWLLRQKDMESSGIKKLNIKAGDVFSPAGLDNIKKEIKKMEITTISGIGFPPVIAIIAAAIAAWSIYKVADALTTTAQEKQELMESTKKTCKEMNFTSDQCAKLIGQTQAEASSGTGFGDLIKYGIIAFLAIVGINAYSKSKSHA